MINSIDLNYLVDEFLKKEPNFQIENGLEPIILYFKKNIDFFSDNEENFSNLAKEDLLISLILFINLRRTTKWFAPFLTRITKCEYSKNGFFQLKIATDVDKSLFLAFKFSYYPDVLEFTHEEITKIFKKKSSFILFNFYYDQGKLKITPYNTISIFNLYRIPKEKWMQKYPQYSKIEKDVYVSRELYKKYKQK
ncbi:MAG: hypothetical protein ACRCVI_02955 [Mycoplasmoidaceae bacterium]